MTGSDHSDKEFRETRNLYVSMMSLYELADKLLVLRMLHLCVLRIYRLLRFQICSVFNRFCRLYLIILREQSRIRSAGRKLWGMDLLCGERGFCCMRLQ